MISLVLFQYVRLVFAQFPDDVVGSMERSQWIFSDAHAKSPCVAIDAHVRFHHENLVVNIAGFCENMQTNATFCEFREWNSDKVVRTPGTVVRAPPIETRGGYVSSLLLSQSQYNNILMWDALSVDCGVAPTSEGTVSIVYGDSQIKRIVFKTPQFDRPIEEMAVCTRLYDIRVWRPWHTVKFIEWLNWNFALGVSCVHLYVHSLFSDDMWNVIRYYQKQYKIVLHDWSETSSNGAVVHGWEMLQVSLLTDCMLRLEGRFRYVGAFDHDEFLNLKTVHTEKSVALSLVKFLDDVYEKNPNATNVVAFDPYYVHSKLCDEPDESLRVSAFCHACDSSFGMWTKYFVRSDKNRPLFMLPYIHSATDGREKITISKDVAWIMHVNRDESPQLRCDKPITVEWNCALSRWAWMLLHGDDVVRSVYVNSLNSRRASRMKTINSPTITSQRRCFKFIDGGANIGDSLLKIAYPDRFPDSELAKEAKARTFGRFKCRQFWAFEGNPVLLDKLQSVCVGLMRDNVTCSYYHALLGTSVDVNVFRLNDFLRNTVTASDFVMIKLDVEGAEYDLLYELATDETACFLVDVLALEWHGMQFVDAESEPRVKLEQKYSMSLDELESFILNKLKACGIEVLSYNGATDK